MTDRPAANDLAPDATTSPGSVRGVWIGGYAVFLAGLLLALQYSLLDHPTDLVDLWKISGGEERGAVVYAGAVVLMSGGWLLAMHSARGLTLRQVMLPVVGITLLIVAAFLLTYPATAIDVYIYAARSHLLTDYGLNPSTVTPDRFWEMDPYVQYASREWGDDTSPYGPLWNIIAAPATALDGERIGAAVLAFKGMMAAGVLVTGALIYDIARRLRPSWSVPAAIGWLWSPIVLWEGIANSHNDVMLVLLVIAAVWCWVTRHEGGIIPLLGAAALLKVVTVMLIPAAIVAIVVRTGWSRRLGIIALQTAGLSIGVLWVAFAPFYDFAGTVEAIQEQRDVWVTSPALLLDLLLEDRGVDVDFGPLYERFSTGVIVALTLGGAIAAWRRPEWLPRIAYEQLFWFLLLATSNMRPWYGIWLVALAVALPIGWPFVRAAAWTIGALVAYVYTAWLQNWDDDPSFLERSAINLAITLVPVLIVTVWEWVRLARQPAPREVRRSTPVPEL